MSRIVALVGISLLGLGLLATAMASGHGRGCPFADGNRPCHVAAGPTSAPATAPAPSGQGHQHQHRHGWGGGSNGQGGHGLRLRDGSCLSSYYYDSATLFAVELGVFGGCGTRRHYATDSNGSS